MVSGKPLTTSETAGNDLSPSLHVKAMRPGQVSAETWASVVIGKYLHIDRSDFASQQGGAKGAVPKGTAPWARTPLGPQSTLLPSNEAALRGSPRWPAWAKPYGDCSRLPALRCPSMALSSEYRCLPITTLANGLAHHEEDADPEGHGGDGDEEGAESGIAAVGDDSSEKEAQGEENGAKNDAFGSDR